MEFLQGPVGSALDRSGRDVEDLGNGLDRPFEVVTEHEDVALVFGQPFERCGQCGIGKRVGRRDRCADLVGVAAVAAESTEP